ncbi:MAG: hypothetical protein ACTMIR_09425 [Cellulomonadaceae bacterium]
MSEDWASRRREAARSQAEHLEAARARDTAAAERLIADFVERARSAQVPSTPLLARGYNGRGRFRTGLQGWYLRANKSVAVGQDGRFYILVADGGLLGRLRGVTVAPSPPPLVLGAGGRDGESISLRDALARVAPES